MIDSPEVNPSNSGHFIMSISNVSRVIGETGRGVAIGVAGSTISGNKCLIYSTGSDQFFSGGWVRAFGGARRKFLKSTPSGSESDPESDLGLHVSLLMTYLLVLSSAVGALASMKGLSCVQPRGEGSNLMTPANGHQNVMWWRQQVQRVVYY